MSLRHYNILPIATELAPKPHRDFFTSTLETIVGPGENPKEIRLAVLRNLEHLDLGFLYDPTFLFAKQLVIMQEKSTQGPIIAEKKTICIALYANRFQMTSYSTSQGVDEELQRYYDEIKEQKSPPPFEDKPSSMQPDLAIVLSWINEQKKARKEIREVLKPDDIADVISGLAFLSGPEQDKEQADVILTGFFYMHIV